MRPGRGVLAHAAVAALGLWLMASPAVLDYARPAATSAWIAGPIVTAFAYLAAASPLGRPARWANMPLGAWLVVAPLLLDHEAAAAANSVAVGALVVVVSLVRGDVPVERFGGGWPSLWRTRHAPSARPR